MGIFREDEGKRMNEIIEIFEDKIYMIKNEKFKEKDIVMKFDIIYMEKK